MIVDKDLLISARSGRKKSGKTTLIKYLTGGRLTRDQAIKAKCYDCDGMGETGQCDIVGCALHPFSSYKASLEGSGEVKGVSEKEDG